MVRDDPGERLTFYRPDAVPGVEILSAFNSTQPWHVYHERYDFCACRTAYAGYTYRGRHARFTDRSVAFLEPGEVHRNTDVRKASDFKVMLIDPSTLKASAEQLGVRTPHFKAAPTEDPAVFNSFYGFCNSVEAGASILEQQSRFAACLRIFLACAESAPRALADESEAMRRARRYLIDRYNDNVTLSELAAVAGVSRFHLVRAFSRRYGMPPHAFQVHVRVERATALLRAGMQASEAATTVGFADQSHLHRHFRRIWGVTPAAYARAR